MNTESGEIRRREKISDEEMKSGVWAELPPGTEIRGGKPYYQGKLISRSDMKRELYMQNVEKKRKEGLLR